MRIRLLERGVSRALLAIAVSTLAACSDSTSPDANVRQVMVSQTSGRLFAGQDLQLSARALDASGAPIDGLTFTWTVSDSTIATVSNTGLVHPRGKRGTVVVTARSGNHMSASATLAATPPAASLTVVSGNDQRATVGQALPQPVVAEAKATDGLPIEGATVTFASAGAVLGAQAATTDTLGRASTTATLGQVAGAISGTASIADGAGGHSAEFVAQGLAGTPTQLVFRQQPSTVAMLAPMNPPVRVAVLDAFGNAEPSAGVITLTLIGGASGANIVGVAGGSNPSSGEVTFSPFSISRGGSGYQLVASSPGLPSVTSAAFDVIDAGVTVTITDVTQTTCDANNVCTTAPANLQSAAGQLKVSFTVKGAILGAAAILRCGADSIVAPQAGYLSQSRAGAGTGPLQSSVDALYSLSINSAAYDSTTGVPSLRNGACLLRVTARPTLANSPIVDQNGRVNLTVANPDVVVGRISTPRSGTRAVQYFGGGDVTMVAIPVLYSGRTPTTVTMGLSLAANGGASRSLPAPTLLFAPPYMVTFPGGTSGTNSLRDITAQGVVPTVNATFAGGSPITDFASVTLTSVSPAVSVSGKRWNLDDERPLAGVMPIKWNTAQETGVTGYVGRFFTFAATAAAGYCGPNSTSFTPANNGTGNPVCAADGSQTANFDARGGIPGVGLASVTFQYHVTGSLATQYTTLTSVSSLNETTATTGNTNSYELRMITADSLGNADTTTVGTFGLDKTAPTATLAAGPANQAGFTTIGTSGNYVFTISDNLSGGSVNPVTINPRALVAQTRLWSGLGGASFNPTVFENRTYTNSGAAGTFTSAQATTDLSPCVIGRFNAAVAAAGASALNTYDRNGNQVGYCTPVFYDMPGNVVAAAAPGTTGPLGGYYTTEVIVVDQAGNHATTFNNVVVEDQTQPSVGGIDIPGSIPGTSTATFPATAGDNLDVVGSFASMAYPSMTLRYPTVAGPGVAFDNILIRSTTISPTVTNFIRTLNAATASGGQTSTVAANVTSVQVTVIDEIGWASSVAPVFLQPYVGVGTETSSTWSSNFSQSFLLSADNSNSVWNCPVTGCGVGGGVTPTNTSITFTTVAAGTTGVFNNPFASVTFWYQDPSSGSWIQFGTAGSATTADDGTFRRWIHTVTWDPPAVAGGGASLVPTAGGTILLPIRAIGNNSSGDAIYTSNAFTLTIKN